MSSLITVRSKIGPVPKPITQIVGETGLSRKSVSKACTELVQQGYAEEQRMGNMRMLSRSNSPGVTFAELFCGPGGMGYGLKRAGFKPLWAVDIDPNACATYEANVGAHAICGPIEEIDFTRQPRVDGLAMGFPCNDFSMVGEKRGTSGYYGSLYEHSVRALEQLSPSWFIAENVPGLITLNGHQILQRFANAGPGYEVTVHKYHLEEYGVPQRRTRIIAVGIRRDMKIKFLPPSPDFGEPVSARQALVGVETVPHNNERAKHHESTIELLRHIPPGGNAWSDSVPKRLRLNVEKVRMSMIYRRLHPDQPSYTVTGSGGGGTHMYHWTEPRALTNRERARLQSFPDDFVFCGGRESVRKQVGMAVPPLGATAIGRALLATLQGETYLGITPNEVILKPNVPRNL